MAGNTPDWQCVMVCWGTKYSARVINHLVGSIRAQAAVPPRFVLITDAPKPGLDGGVILRAFPDYFLQPKFRLGGCLAKLVIFQAGVVPDDLPAIYLDLDTVISGDLGRGIALMRSPRSILILHSAILRFGPLPRLIWRLTDGRRYARGNSSVVIYHPAQCGYVAERFRALQAQHPGGGFRPMMADERFISWVAQPDMIAIPDNFAVKLSREFMFPLRFWLPFRARLPWVKARRAAQVAVTLCGDGVKPEDLLALPEGATLTDRKGRALIWTDAAMGAARARIIAHCRAVLE